jgi:hypothetical protein
MELQEPSPQVIDWRPGTSEAMIWNIFATVLVVVGLPLFALPSILRKGTAGASFQIGMADVLLVVALTAVLLVLHEAIHGLVMLAVGARPTFGALLVARVMPAFYATSVGHRFSRAQYMTVAAAPAVAISVIGFLLCFGSWGGYLIVPLAIHLGGCVGDFFAVGRVLREPRGTEFEDLRDGIRFHRKPAMDSCRICHFLGFYADTAGRVRL